MGDAVGDAQKTFVAKRVREAVDEPGGGVVRAGGAEFGERFAGVGLDEVAFAVFEVDDDAGGCREESLVGEDELADAFARGPGVDEIGGAGVGEEAGFGEELVVGRGDKQRDTDRGNRFGAGGHGDDAGVAGGAEGVGEAGDVVEAVGGEVAVVDEEDVHEERRGRRSRRRTGAGVRLSRVSGRWRRRARRRTWRRGCWRSRAGIFGRRNRRARRRGWSGWA